MQAAIMPGNEVRIVVGEFDDLRHVIRQDSQEPETGQLINVKALSSARDREIASMMALDRAYWEPTLREPAEDEKWGGASGGPLFSLVRSDSLVSWRFSGVVVQCLPITGAQILRAAPITPVRPDGTIRDE